jgi:hypothetical protein
MTLRHRSALQPSAVRAFPSAEKSCLVTSFPGSVVSWCDVAQTLGALFSIDDLTGFEITKAVELPEPYGIIVVWGLVLPALFIFANAATQLAFKDALILKARH